MTDGKCLEKGLSGGPTATLEVAGDDRMARDLSLKFH